MPEYSPGRVTIARGSQHAEYRPSVGVAIANLGCGGFAFFFVVGLVALTVLRLIHGPGLPIWWRDLVGDPVFRLLVKGALAAQGDSGRTILFCGLGYFAMLWALMGFEGSLVRASAGRMRLYTPATIDVDTAQDQLRRIFSDDPEQVALYETTQAESKPKPSRSLALGGLGCLMSALCFVLTAPIKFLVTLSMFDGMQRLFGITGASRSIEASTGPVFAKLQPLLPLDKFVFGVELTQRNLRLTLFLGLLAALYWFVSTAPIVRLMWPRGITRASIAMFAFGLLTTYFVTNGLLLYLAVIAVVFHLATSLAGRFVVRPLRLMVYRVWSHIRGRVHREQQA